MASLSELSRPLFVLLLVILPMSSANVEIYADQGLTSVPGGMDSGITNLDMSYNAIRRVEANDLAALTQVVKFHLVANQVHFIDDAAFIHCMSLEQLSLSRNKLIILPDANSITPLRYLWMNWNVKPYIPINFFKTLDGLGCLGIIEDELNILPRFGVNATLFRLMMQDNPIRTLPDLSSVMPALSYFDVDNDHIVCDWGSAGCCLSPLISPVVLWL